jgi:hypothetical protein
MESLTFGTIATITLAYSLCQVMSSMARVHLQRFQEAFRDSAAALEKSLS